tara:strand:- start:65 stop:205 length:141 start_codon:yes stop_codon:yes gene_type:complete
MTESSNGKGDRRRPEDGKKFRQNFAEIFKKFDREPAPKKKKKRKDK